MRLVALKRVYSRYVQLRQLYMDANVASTNRLPRVSLFLIVQVKYFGDFFHDAQIEKVLIRLFEDL